MRYYSSTAGAMTLTGDVSAPDGSIAVSSTVGLPTSFPYTLVVDAGQASEEIVEVTNASGLTLTVLRGVDGTSPQAHSLGASVRHMMTARDLREPQQHIDATAGVHGVVGSVVGTTDTQTLTNKNLTSGSNTFPASLARGTDLTAHANTTSGVHGVTGSLVGTTDAQTLTNKTVSGPDGTFTGTVWTDITVAASFAALNTSEKPQVRRIGKTVYVQGGWANTGMAANATHVIGTLPAGFRPTQNVLVQAGSSAGSVTATVFFSSSGDVSIRTGPALGAYYKPNATYLID